MRHFIFQDEKSHKFWAVEQQGNELHINWGKVGTNGQSQVKSFADAAAAEKAELKLIAEKIKKGYVDDGSPETIINSPISSTVSVQELAISTGNFTTTETAQPQAMPTLETPPWLKNGESIVIFANAEPAPFSHRHLINDPLDIVDKDGFFWIQLKEYPYWAAFYLACLQKFDVSQCQSEWQLALQETISRIQKLQQDGSLLSDVILTLTRLIIGRPGRPHTWLDSIVQLRGLEYATELVIAMQHVQMTDDANIDPTKNATLKLHYNSLFSALRRGEMADNYYLPVVSLSHDISDMRYKYGFSDEIELRLREHLSHTDEETWQRCANKLIDALPSLPPRKRPLIAFLLPEKPDIANQIALEIAPMHDYPEIEWLSLVTTDPQATCLLKNFHQLELTTGWGGDMTNRCIKTLLREQGLNALSRLQEGVNDSYPVRHALQEINHPDVVTLFIKEECAIGVEISASKYPESALYALTAALLSAKNLRYSRLMERIVLGNAQTLRNTMPWLSEEQKQLLFSYFPQLHAKEEIANACELPGILTNPIWLKKKNKSATTIFTLPVLPLESIGPNPQPQPEAEIPSTAEVLRHLGFSSGAFEENNPDPERFDIKWGVTKTAIRLLETEDYESLLNTRPKYDYEGFITFYVSILTRLPAEKALSIWNGLSHMHLVGAEKVVERFGLSTVPGLLRYALVNPKEAVPLAAQFGATEVALLMARAFCQLKSVRDVAEYWLTTYPEHAITGLLPIALGKPVKEQQDARMTLRYLVNNGHLALLKKIASRYQQPEVITALTDFLAADPLENYPQKIAKLPGWCSPEVWHRPLLRSNGKALSDSAILHLCTMLSFPREATLYPGITQVIEACTPQSLADFAWDLFLSWESASGSAKDNWAFTALGILGNDDTARKLTPLIRAWPGESQHKRATVGLDILAAIGSDIALMQLNGIAQKLKFKALQDQARVKIAQIAESRQLTVAEMEDRLAPDLGLDDNGSLLLDFGPRQFTVSFDESLKPFVRDASGSRLKDLPKPNKSDDETLAEEAVNRYKLLKKDVRTVAAQQISRLEAAMCQRRRWTAKQFRLFLVEHPLVRHITQRLMWGVYDADNQLITCFRVAEDGSFSDGQDNPLTPAQGSIGIPHVLEIPAPQAAEFAQLFSDYELLPPFRQLDRPWSQLSDSEKNSNDLQRWAGRQAPSGRVAGLMNKGWQRGDVLDGGGYYSFYKAVDDGYVELSVTPGFSVGLPVTEISASQKIEHIQLCKLTPHKSVYPFSVLDDITASELINDIESLFD